MTTRSRFGPYVLSQFNATEPYLNNWNPSWVMLNAGEAKLENVNKVKQLSPNTKVCCRLYKPDHEYTERIRADPEGYAREIIDELKDQDWYGFEDSICTTNEVLQDWSGLDYLNRFYVELQKYEPRHLLLVSSSVENLPWTNNDPDGDHASLMKHHQKMFPAMRTGKWRGDLYGAHQYNAPRLTVGDYQRMLRAFSKPGVGEAIAEGRLDSTDLSEDIKTDIRRVFRWETLVYPYLPDDVKMEVLFSEFGWDYLLWPTYYKAGWLDPAAAISTDDAVGQLSWFSDLWDHAFVDHVPCAGWVLYGAGQSSPWEYYDILSTEMPNGEHRDRPLAQAIVENNPGGEWPRTAPLPPVEPPVEPPIEPPVEPPIEPPEDEMIEVFDTDGNRQTWDWLVDRYGEPMHSYAPAGERAFRVYRIQAVENGESSAKVDVRNEEGEPNDNNACFYWEDAPQQSQGCATQPYDNFIVQATGANGQTSFALGTGSYYTSPPDVGYHKIWICSSLPSDVVNSGMLANTNHFHLDFWYGISEGEEPVDPPIDPPVEPPVVSSSCCETVKDVAIAALEMQQKTIDRLLDMVDMTDEAQEKVISDYVDNLQGSD